MGLSAVLPNWIVRWNRAAALALVVALPLVASPWGRDAYSQPKVLVLYALAAALLAGWLVLWVGFRLPRWTLTGPELPWWAFLAAVLLSTGTSAVPRLSILGAPGRYEGLFALGCYALLFFAGVHFFGSGPRLRQLMLWIALTAAVAVAYGVAQVFTPPLFAGEAYIRSWYGALGVPRVASTLGSPIVFGGYLAFVLPLLLALALTARRHWRSLWLGVLWLAILTITLTLTRAAWLAGVIGVAVFVCTAGPGARRRGLLLSLAAAAVAAVVVSGTVAATPQQMGARVTSVVSAESSSVLQRLYIWERTVDLIRARPLLGWGLESLREVFPYERASLVPVFGLRPTIIDKAHNDVLQVAVSVGVPGAMAYVAMWAAVLLGALRLVRRAAMDERIVAAGALAALAAYLVQVQFSFSTVALTPVVWLLAGAVCGWEAA